MLQKLLVKYFSVLPKQPKLEINLRTPTRTIFKSFHGFNRLYVNGPDNGLIGLSSNSFPRIYFLTSGYLSLKGYTKGPGSYAKNDSGDFVHSGGWLVMHDNNTMDIDLIECVEKENFKYEKVNTTQIDGEASLKNYFERRLQELAIKGLTRKI
jgi:hypothetical protein